MEANFSKPSPPGITFVADGLPGSIPNQVIEQVMKETLDWDVKVARVIVRNKGKEATKSAFLKCTGRPALTPSRWEVKWWSQEHQQRKKKMQISSRKDFLQDCEKKKQHEQS